MENFELRLSNILNIISTKGASGFDTEKVDELERLLLGMSEQTEI